FCFFVRSRRRTDDQAVLCAAPPALFMGAAGDHRRENHIFFPVQDTEPFRAVYLMTAQSQKIHTEALHINAHMTECLDGVNMELCSMFRKYLANLIYLLHSSCFDFYKNY